jgi:negative regulator of sigma E activity
MPSRPDTIDERFEEIVAQLRAARPEPSTALRERVQGLAQQPAPAPRRRFRLAFPTLRPMLAAAAAAGIAAVAVGIATQVGGGESRDQTEAGRALPGQELEATKDEDAATDSATAPSSAEAGRSAATPPPSGTRLQDYRAELRVRVDSVADLSRATSQAMRTARSLGGYVVTAQLETPAGEDGDSVLVFRVPVSRVQEAIVRLTGLGELLSQRISLEDLQAPLERQTDAVGELRARVRRLDRQVRNPDLAEEERARLQLELLQARQQLTDQIRQRDETLRRGRLALVSLTLTTRAEEEAVPVPPGDTEQRLRDALAALAEMVTWGLYVLIVAGPFLVLAAIGVAVDRRRRRRADDRLLERA